MVGQEEPVEPVVEESPEAFYYAISKYAGDTLFPAEFEQTDSLPLSRYNSEGIMRQEFFDQVRSYFSSIRASPRASRAGQRQGPTYTGGNPAIQFNDQERPYLEELEKMLILKFRGPDFQGSVYRTKREAERRDGSLKEETIRPMSKEEVLRDLYNKISAVQWREPNYDHKPTVGHRPGISKVYQRELDNE